jgi:hypothetical protein
MADPDVIERHIWSAVNRIVGSTDIPVPSRDKTAGEQPWNRGTWCHVPSYRATTATHGTVPGLWEQSANALIGAEHDNTGPGGDPAERNPCDIDLMEIRGIIRDTTTNELHRFRLWPERDDTPAQLVQLAKHVIRHDRDNLWWWEYRLASWGRLLATYLGQVDRANRDRWLRNAPCPECRARGVLRPSDHDADRKVWVPALVVEFRDGYVRGVVCQACGAYAFRGEELWELKARIDTLVPAQVAETA